MSRHKIVMYVFCSLIVSAIPGAFAQDEATESKDDPVVVQVNSEEITESEVLAEIQKSLKQMGGRIPPAQREKANALLFNQVVNNMISVALLEDVAKKQKIEVTDEELDEQIESIKQQLPENVTLEMALAQQGMTEASLKEEIKKGEVIQKVLEKNVKAPDQPTEAEMKQFYEDNPRFSGEQIRASHILLQFPEGKQLTADEKAEMKAKLAAIRADILAEKISFAEAAQENSDCPSSAQGGDLEFFRRGMMVPEFEKVAFETKVGDITDIVETKFGYHIIKVTDKKTPTYESQKETIAEMMTAKERNEAVQQYLEMLRKTGKIEQKMSQEEWISRNSPSNGQQKPSQSIQIDPDMLK